ncbi:neprilysin-2 [Acyrthosiphon pisum]|uniref:Membrane metallo-endopeptidase-like 1 n=1 Tax=Acyrthosiphon pisum TaxID=7029 RepID=A0A8R2JPV4_ACYPI|nr:neprilysin-2 [Acyrthosiphon pisum]|eukprot:XP_001951427.1 PREDICTED: neprilysin-11-like [Acyrthosiphon pisum]
MVAGRMLSSFLALALSMLYLNHSCNAKSLPSISSKENGLVAHSLRLLQDSKFEEGKLLCLSKGCVKAAASLINDMDRSVDPCDDFYQFACGSFIKNTIFDDVKMSVSKISEIEDAIANWKQMIVEEPIQPDELRPFKMMKLLYKSCMDQEHIEKIGLEPIKEMFKSLGGWPVLEAEKWNESKFTWMDSIHKLIVPGKKTNDYFINFSLTILPENMTNLLLYMDKASLGLKSEYLVKGKDHEVVEKYYKYIVDIAVLFGADRQRATKELSESLDFEIELAKIEEQWDPSNINYKYKQVDILTLQDTFPSTPWKEFFDKLLNKFIRQDDFLLVSSMKFLEDLLTLLNKTPKRVQANYVIQRSVIDSLSYLTEELRNRNYKYMKELKPNFKVYPRRAQCATISTTLFDLAIVSLYVRRVFNENAKQNALRMVNGIKEELYKTLSSNDWMDDRTREKAMDKAKAMTHDIAYPDELLDDSKLNAYYENLDVNDQYFYTSILNFTKFKTDNYFSMLMKTKPDWVFDTTFVANVNAQYGLRSNNIVLPAGILQGAFFSNDRPQYMIYGGIGFIIGHEITHGFDSTGKRFDMHGNKTNWWTEETNKRFMEKQSCFINQYGNYTVHEIGLKVDGNLTLSDNMSDNGGLKLTYDAYRVWVKEHGVEPRLPGLQEYTPQQMFWLSNANAWCSKSTLEYQKYQITNGEHAPERFRIIGSFSNIKYFSDDFQCPLGSNMNPVKKCHMW